MGFIIMAAAALAMVAVMVCAWAVARKTGNGGWIDVFWTFGCGALGIAFAAAPTAGPEVTWRQMAVAILVALWAMRLGVYVLARVASGPEDARYAVLREAWGPRYASRLLGFAILQAAAAIGLALVMRLAAINPDRHLRLFDLLGVAVMVAAVGGEAIADAQLARFKAEPANHGKVCDIGLWSWSRHPNYFFEWLGWLAYPLFAIDPGGEGWRWFSLLGPILMYAILVHGSGIPPLERHILRSRGEAYRAYQARTSAFIPRPPRR